MLFVKENTKDFVPAGSSRQKGREGETAYPIFGNSKQIRKNQIACRALFLCGLQLKSDGHLAQLGTNCYAAEQMKAALGGSLHRETTNCPQTMSFLTGGLVYEFQSVSDERNCHGAPTHFATTNRVRQHKSRSVSINVLATEME